MDAGNTKFRPGRKVLSSAAQKPKKDRDKFSTTTRVVLEDHKARWVRLKVALKDKSDHKLAEVLHDTSVY